MDKSFYEDIINRNNLLSIIDEARKKATRNKKRFTLVNLKKRFDNNVYEVLVSALVNKGYYLRREDTFNNIKLTLYW